VGPEGPEGPAGAGESNTASNVGAGVGKVFKQKVGVDLELKSIKAGTGISISNDVDEVTINNTILPTKEKFFSPGSDTSNTDNYSNKTSGSTAQSYMAFHIPHDFISLVSLELVYFNTTALVAVDIDLNSSYGALGEAQTNHQESDTVTTYSSNANELDSIDLSPVFSLLAANDFCGINIDHNGIGSTQRYLGIRMRYN